jgi:ABC-type dipeptide/oligopeptide/nickel transport system permease component
LEIGSAVKLWQAIPMLFLISIVLFALANIAPGNPVAAVSGQRPRPQVRERVRRQFGLDKPLPVQYVVWLIGNDWMRIDADGDGIAESRGEWRGVLCGD